MIHYQLVLIVFVIVIVDLDVVEYVECDYDC
jgi:hypothetical protein